MLALSFRPRHVFAAVIVGGALLSTSCATTDVPVGNGRRTTMVRDELARKLERIEKGPLSEEEAPTFFLVGEELYFDRNIDSALKVFQAVFQVSPTLVTGMRLNEIYILKGQLQDSEKVVNRLAVLFPKSPEPPIALARILMAEEKIDAALAVLKEAYASLNRNSEIGIGYVDTLLRAGKKQDARVFLEKETKDSAAVPFFLRKLAEIRIEEKKYIEAKTILDKLLRVAPEDVEGWTLAGYVAMEEKDFVAAEKYFREAYLKQPENDALARYYVMQLLRQEKYQEARRLLVRLEGATEKEFDSELTFQLALVLFKLEDYVGAKVRFLRIAKDDAFGRAFFYAGQCDDAAKNTDGALENFAKVPEKSLFRIQALQRTSFLLLEQGKFDQVRAVLTGISISDSSDEGEFLFLAAVHGRMQEFTKAIEIASQGLKKFPDSAELSSLFAGWLEYTKSRNDAIVAMEAVLKKHPKHASALNYLAYSLAEMGKRIPEALQFAKKAVELEPKNGFYMDTLGWVYFKSGKLSEADLYLERALKLETEEPVILEHLGEVSLAHKDYPRALKSFEAAERVFASQPAWKLKIDKEWRESRKRVGERIQELRDRAAPKKDVNKEKSGA
jgi:tetratricopeptide (TPR) repeat protein